MSEAAESPIVVAILFALRCLVPLILMLGVSFLLKRLGLIAEPPQAPPDEDNGQSNNKGTRKTGGGVAHGKV